MKIKNFTIFILLFFHFKTSTAQLHSDFKTPIVDAFSLYNKSTGKPVSTLVNNCELDADLFDDVNITIMASVKYGKPGSIVFYVDGKKAATENNYPYLLGNKIPEELLEAGKHKITAIPYSKADGKGTEGKSLTIFINIVVNKVSYFTLYDIADNKDLKTLSEGDTIIPILYSDHKLNIRATTIPKYTGSVLIELDNKFKVVDNSYPYTFGVKLPDYFLKIGTHSIKATAFTKPNAKGNKSKTLTINIVVETIRTTNAVLFDQASGKDLYQFSGKDTIDKITDQAVIPNLRINTIPKNVGSVIIELDNKFKVTQNIYPYTFDNKLPAEFLTPGMHTIIATPYSKKDGKGVKGIAFNASVLISDPDEVVDESSAGVLSLIGISETSFNSTTGTLVLDLTGATFLNDPSRQYLTINGSPQNMANATIEPNRISIPLFLPEALIQVEFLGTDTKELPVAGNFAFWAGSRLLPVTVVDPSGIPVSGAKVEVVLADDNEVKVSGLTDANGIITFTNIIPRTLVVTATAANNLFATAGVVGLGTALTIQLKGFEPASTINNNDFSLGLEGWNVGTSPVTIIPHTEGEAAKGLAILAVDNDLQLLTNGPGPQSVSRTFIAQAGVNIRYRFVTSEVPGGYYGSQFNDYYSVSLRNQTKGSSKSEGKAMNSFSLSEFDAEGGIAWRELPLSASPGDVIQVDITVANVADGLLNSYVLIDFIADTKFEITSAELKDIDNSALNYLSLDDHSYFAGYTRVNGSITLKGSADSRLSKLQLEVYKNKSLITTGTLAPGLEPTVLTQFGTDETITVTNASPLFQIPAANLSLPSGDVQLKIVAELETGEKKTYDVKSVKVLTKFEWTSRFSGRDDTQGGDDWGDPSVVSFIETSLPSNYYLNDLSNMNGGKFPGHSSHTTGMDLDCRFTQARPSPVRMNTVEIAQELLDLLNSPAGHRINYVLVTFDKTDTDPFWNVVKDDPAVSKIRKYAGHEDHFHLNIFRSATGLKAAQPQFYIAPARDVVTQLSTPIDSISKPQPAIVIGEMDKVIIRPNPAQTSVRQFQISGFSKEMNGGTVSLYDMSGRLLYYTVINNSGNYFVLRIPAGIANKTGIYIVTLQKAGTKVTKKIFIE